MTHPYTPGCCALPACHEVHDWLKSARVTTAYATAISLRTKHPHEFRDEFLADCIMEAVK